MSWFARKTPTERTPGGSVVIRHGSEAAQCPIGLTDESTAGFGASREAAYQKLFGEALNVSHEVFPLIPHVDVYTFCRSRGERKVYALVTGGMSDLPMTLMRGDTRPRRVELVLYCSEPKEEYIATLRWLAHFPHTYKTFVGYGDTIPNGNPPAPFWGSEILETILLMPTIVTRDQQLEEELQLDGDPVSLLWVVPISKAECALKLKKGFAAILDLFDEHKHPHIFDPERKSYV